MEYITMFITHLFKTAHFFAVEGIPVVPIEDLPEAVIGIGYNLAKIISIYALLLG